MLKRWPRKRLLFVVTVVVVGGAAAIAYAARRNMDRFELSPGVKDDPKYLKYIAQGYRPESAASFVEIDREGKEAKRKAKRSWKLAKAEAAKL